MDKHQLATFEKFSTSEAIREMHLVSDFEKDVYGESQIVPGKKIQIGTIAVCPNCSSQIKPFEHGKPVICNCGLKMLSFGNALYCAMEQKLATKLIKPLMKFLN